MCPTNPSLVACTAYSKVQLYSMETMELHKTITKFKDMAFSGRWRRDGGVFCAGTGKGGLKVFYVNTKVKLGDRSGVQVGKKFCFIL